MRSLLFSLLALGLAAEARADKFWLVDLDRPGKPGSEYIEAVLLAETPTTYRLRIVGGELVLPKARVHRVEQDGLTVAQIEAAEAAVQEAAAAADAERRRAQQRQQQAAQPPRGEPVDASLQRRPEPVRQPVRGRYDPILHRYEPVPGEMTPAELRRELQYAYRVTRDPRYLVELRKLQRR